jgi:hypothetical protein
MVVKGMIVKGIDYAAIASARNADLWTPAGKAGGWAGPSCARDSRTRAAIHRRRNANPFYGTAAEAA